MRRPLALLVGLGLSLAAAPAGAALSIVSQFDPAGVVDLCGVALEPGGQTVWVYPCLGANILRHTSDGTPLAPIPRPGEAANDIDLQLVHGGFALESTALPAGTLLVVNGETAFAEVHAIDPTTGAVLDVLPTLFGNSHVVGGVWHPIRRTLFMVQDRNGGGQANRIAEVDPITGAVITSFSVAAIIDVNYGDIDVCAASGNLFIVSSLSTSIAEITPTGALVQSHALPVGVSSLSGIGFDDLTGEAVVSGTGGVVWRLAGLPCGVVSAPPGSGVVVALGAAFPNPSRGVVSLRLTLAREAAVTVDVYDVAGRRVRGLAGGTLGAGAHDLRWDARDERGERVRPGVYFYRVTAGEWRDERRCVIIQP